VPWEFTPKDDLHRLTDIIAKGPQLRLEAEDLPNQTLEQSLPTLLTILSRLLDIDAELEAFYNELHARSTYPLYWEALTSGCFTQENIDLSAPSHLEFADHKTASLLTLYSSSSARYFAYQKVFGSCSQSPLATADPDHQSQHGLLHDSNVGLCRSASYWCGAGNYH
jgi:hypothetical protein